MSIIAASNSDSWAREAEGGNQMNVNLTVELEQLVHHKVQSGRYNSASDVVSEALQLLAERDDLVEAAKQNLREKISQGFDSIRRGDCVDGHEFFAQLEREEQELLRNRQPA